MGIKIRHAELEICRADPSAWVHERLNPAGSPRGGYNQCIGLGIHRFHRTNDRRGSLAYVREILKRFKNASRVAQAEATLEAYIDWWATAGLILGDDWVRINYDLGSSVTLAGRVSRIDLSPKTMKYRAVLIGTFQPGWEHELRMPLLQLAIAGTIRRPPADTEVGVQNLDGTGLSVVSFGATAITNAVAESANVASQISSAWTRLGGP